MFLAKFNYRVCLWKKGRLLAWTIIPWSDYGWAWLLAIVIIELFATWHARLRNEFLTSNSSGFNAW